MIDTGDLRFDLARDRVDLPVPVIADGARWSGGAYEFVDEHGIARIPEILSDRLDVHGPLSCDVVQEAEIAACGLRVRSTLRFFRGTSRVRARVTLHNPKAATHPAGLWDLGDPGSVMFQDFSLNIPIPPGASMSWRGSGEDDFTDAGESLLIYQESSGGDNYLSENHRNRHGVVPIRIRGYRIERDGSLILEGGRISPTVRARSSAQSVAVHLADFWQNFPSAIRCSAGASLQVALFPREYPDVFELQGGESKSYELEIDYSNDGCLASHDHPLIATIPPSSYAGIPPFTRLMSPGLETRISRLLDGALTSTQCFIAKREVVDEYGWRNFGDVLADHESDRSPGKVLISHYNNQYDLIYGFGRQFIETGDPGWFELHRSLARHVYDIDIYKTAADRPQYNGGLFWHTDHYVDAGLSTHRSFSKEQPHGAYDGHARGGGPAAEHCYTRGLALHHLLTGDELSREACLTLTEWMIRVHDGPTSLLDWASRTLRRDLAKLIRIMRGDRLLRFRYPLTRGTGNFLRCLLDAFILTNEMQYLRKAEEVIRDTAHPSESIGDRGLVSDIEANWSYTIFLTAVGEYLDLKLSFGATDDAFLYARDLLLHFAEWMVKHEAPYLSRPEILEFPNHTWTAQEIRKAVVLAYAAEYALRDRPEFLEKAQWFADHCAEQLGGSSDRHYTRIRAILLQNFDLQSIYNSSRHARAVSIIPQRQYTAPVPHTPFSFLMTLIRQFGRTVKRASVEKEIKTLRRLLMQLKSTA